VEPRGKLISFEGGEGTGKSTQTRLLKSALEARGKRVVLTREPGGSPGAEEIRRLVVEGEPQRWTPLSETLLFIAARADHVARVIEPALARGDWVVSDRFSDSTYVYQGVARGLEPPFAGVEAAEQQEALADRRAVAALGDLGLARREAQLGLRQEAVERVRGTGGDRRRGGDFEMWFWLMPANLSIEAGVTATRSVIGTVRGQSGSAISGATVTLISPSGPRTAVTDAQGPLAFPNLAPDHYVVTAQFGDLSAETQVTVPGTPGPIPPIFDPGDSPGRRLDEVRGLGPTFIARLEASGITHPAEVAALEPTALAEILRVPESRASNIIAEAQRLLTG
jgi:dTMP kinase